MSEKKQVTALALFSGGLDSILACRVVSQQGIIVKAIKFVTPFFDYDLLDRKEQYREEVWKKYAIDVVIRDITPEYLELLKNPPHGFGKHFNPCIDCKILMIRQAKALMPRYGASFIITGEVIGQRPMSQRRDTLRVIEKDSCTDSILLRPLCTNSQPPTLAETEGLIDRGKLPQFSGRGRSQQIELAAHFGITDYPAPAGGCMLTDRNLSKRIKAFYSENVDIQANDIRLLLVGRQFRLPGGSWLVLGRDQKDNEKLSRLQQPGDIVLGMPSRPGPVGILRHCSQHQDISSAASLVVRYGRKQKNGPPEALVHIISPQGESDVKAAPLADTVFKDWFF